MKRKIHGLHFFAGNLWEEKKINRLKTVFDWMRSWNLIINPDSPALKNGNAPTKTLDNVLVMLKQEYSSSSPQIVGMCWASLSRSILHLFGLNISIIALVFLFFPLNEIHCICSFVAIQTNCRVNLYWLVPFWILFLLAFHLIKN